MGYYVNPSAESFAAIARSKSGFYQYCKSNIKQKKIQEVSIKTAFTFLAEGKHIVSFVGAGGKSSLIDAIAKWSSSQGKKVLVTTTTHIFRPQDEFLAMNEKQLQEIWAAGHWAVIGATEEKDPQKLKMPEFDWMRQAMELSDLVLIEADGSKRLPCKVPADHEPVLLPESDIVVAVLGLSALGRSLKECCFRLEKAKKLLSADENHLLTEKDIAVLQDGEQIEGYLKRSSEYLLHEAALKARPDCNAVVHTHAPYLTAFAYCNKDIKLRCSSTFALLFEDIPCLSYGQPGTKDIANGIEDAIKEHDLILLGNHGCLTVAPTLEKAIAILEAGEEVMKIYTIASSIGTIKNISNDEWEKMCNEHPGSKRNRYKRKE